MTYSSIIVMDGCPTYVLPVLPDSFELSCGDNHMLCALQCHPTLPVLATSGIEHSIKLWLPDGPAEPVDPVSCALRTRKNQERIMSGPQVLRSISPRVFQVREQHCDLPLACMHASNMQCPNTQELLCVCQFLGNG